VPPRLALNVIADHFMTGYLAALQDGESDAPALEGVEGDDGESDDDQPEHDGIAERLAGSLRRRAPSTRSRQLRNGGACHGETPTVVRAMINETPAPPFWFQPQGA
jgi:hypothetical protein